MARKTKEVTIEAAGRDAGKTYVITEMPADQAEWWAFRVMQAIAGEDMGDVPFDAPMAELAPVLMKKGLAALAKMPPDVARPLFDEMMACVSMRLPAGGSRRLLPDDIEEVATRVKLRTEVLELHVGFFELGGE